MRAALVFVLSALSLLAPGALKGGAWPQDAGHWFVSSGLELGRETDPALSAAGLPITGWSSFYADYGLSKRLTLTLDYGQTLSGLPGQSGAGRQTGYVLLRWDLAPEAQLRRSVSAGLGWSANRPHLHFGLHLGRGFDSGWGSGWVNLDLKARGAREGDAPEVSLDLVGGLNRWTRAKLLLGLQAQGRAGETP